MRALLDHPVTQRLRRVLYWTALAVLAFFVYRQYFPAVDLTQDHGAAADFTLEDTNGQPFRLSAQRGNVVVLNFWATWCPPCRAEIPGFIDLQEAFRDEGVVFVGVALDDEGAAVVGPYAEARGINYPVLVDGHRVSARYGGIGTVPTTFVLDRQGRIRFVHSGLLLEHALRPILEALVDIGADAG